MALTHYFWFAYLDGKRLDVDTSISQNWVSSLSLVLANAFRLLLWISLGISITQHLWRMVRTKSMSISDFDRLHFIRYDLRALLHGRTALGAPMLFAMGVIGWGVTVASIFPPGALTVTSASFTSVGDGIVPTFNGSFAGNNNTYGAAENYMLGMTLFYQYLYDPAPCIIMLSH